MTKNENKTTKLDAKKLQDEYNQRFAWMLNFRESVPTILRIAEEMGVEMIESRWDIGLAHLRFKCAGDIIGDITKSPPGSKDPVIYFRVSKAQRASDCCFREQVETPDQLEGVCRAFCAALVKRLAEERQRIEWEKAHPLTQAWAEGQGTKV